MADEKPHFRVQSGEPTYIYITDPVDGQERKYLVGLMTVGVDRAGQDPSGQPLYVIKHAVSIMLVTNDLQD